MKYFVGFVAFWYDFIVGDDWSVAAAVVAGLIGTALLARVGISAWWLLPLAVVTFLAICLGAKRP